MDDILVYRRQAELFMVVVNAANAEDDEAWLRAVLERNVMIDREHPARQIDITASLRNLKQPASGNDQLVDTALQGPASLSILCDLAETQQLRDQLVALRPFSFIEERLAGLKALISRTGYTGEPLGFEIYVHPEAMNELFRKLIEVGEGYGLEISGLGARDTTRTEAGLPLHEHELAGEHNIDPIEAGYGSFVKLHKPWFIGRDAIVRSHKQGKRRVVRFEADGGGRMLRPGCPVVEARRSRVIGRVTSCTVVGGVQIGMAIVPTKFSAPATELAIYPLPSRVPPAKAVNEIEEGDMVVLAKTAKVIERFRR